MNYWQNRDKAKDKAKEHARYMGSNYVNDITNCTMASTVYGGDDKSPAEYMVGSEKNQQTTLKMTTTDALHYISKNIEGTGKRVCLLNFASYKNPGGMFMAGSMAQEEALCHSSFLYNVLCSFNGSYYAVNRRDQNRALYRDRAIYSPDVKFFDNEGNYVLADVLTCAAPNRSVQQKYGMTSDEENVEALRQRIVFIRNIIAEHEVDVVILGAWGCGVFGQDSNTVAELMYKTFEGFKADVVYAVPDDQNLAAFEKECNKP